MKQVRNNNDNPSTNIKKTEFLKNLDEDAIMQLNGILNEYETMKNDIEKSNKSSNETPKNVIEDIQNRHEKEIESFLIQYKQRLIEIAYQEVPEQNELLSKADEFERSDDNMNSKKFSRMAIENGEEIIQKKLNNQKKILNDQYKKLLCNHSNEIKEVKNQIQMENKKNSKQINGKINDLIVKRDTSLLDVRTEYLNQWAKHFPNDDRFMMFKRFMQFFEPILQERGIPVPKTANISNKKGISSIEGNKNIYKTMKKNLCS